MSTDAIRPLGATADRATARLGPSLHIKGEISGNEDLTTARIMIEDGAYFKGSIEIDKTSEKESSGSSFSRSVSAAPAGAGVGPKTI